jgi:hypothetical protein
MYEIVTHRWEEGRVVISRKRPIYETEAEAKTALSNIKKNRNLIYNIREVKENGN